ncbi:MAG: matrixin family metalloprotease [Candidatus Diapherotrites archaeon]|nr:matrixin family metalloprotease [Candidatus Diapherotrites archaeon]
MGVKHFAAFFILLVLALGISASASMLIPANDNAKENSQAPEYSPVIGDNWDLERVDFIHYAKPPSNAKPSSTSCYKLMGVKWTALPVNYVINPSNPQGLSESSITSAISASAETWDNATSQELFNNSYGIDYAAQYGVQNFQNAIAFGDYPDSGVIGVTSVWYTRVGKRIVEFDMLLNTDFAWGDAAENPLLMDLQNIATHELGHSVGLSDIYSTTCNTVTMFGYSTEGETSKRTLEQPDIAGLQRMYGA